MNWSFAVNVVNMLCTVDAEGLKRPASKTQQVVCMHKLEFGCMCRHDPRHSRTLSQSHPQRPRHHANICSIKLYTSTAGTNSYP